VFHQFRENLKGLKAEVESRSGGGNIQYIQYVGYIGRGNIQNILDIQVGSSGGGGNCETSEYASEVSEDYNSVDGSTSEARRGILKRARSLPPEEFLLPQKLVEQLRLADSIFEIYI